MALFSAVPTYVYEESISFKTDITTYEDGTEQRMSRGSPRRMFTMRFRAVSESIRNTIHTFFETVYGAQTTFTWVNPLDNVTYNVRFLNDTIEEENIGYNETDGDIFNIELQAIEVI